MCSTIFIKLNDYFTREPVIISRPYNNTTAEPIDSWEWPVFLRSQAPTASPLIQPVCYLLTAGGGRAAHATAIPPWGEKYGGQMTRAVEMNYCHMYAR